MLLLEQSRKWYGKTFLIRISEAEDGSKRLKKKLWTHINGKYDTGNADLFKTPMY